MMRKKKRSSVGQGDSSAIDAGPSKFTLDYVIPQ